MQHFAKLPLVLLLLLLVSFVASVPLNNEIEASANGLSERVKRQGDWRWFNNQGWVNVNQANVGVNNGQINNGK
uniref:Secreted protein n=1 Tax=Globodera pallida TaxID=36090 RepID=A0A183BYA0_GLOPA